MQNKQYRHSFCGVVNPYLDIAPIYFTSPLNYFKMNQTQLVIDTFNDLLQHGDVTTLDVKLFLRAKFPTETWTQNFVSSVLIDYEEDNAQIGFKDNGTFRIYFLHPAPPMFRSTPYSYTTSKGIKIEANTWLDVMETALKLGDKIHWSQSKKKFFMLHELQENHLLNIIWKETSEMTPKEVAEFLQTSSYVKELIRRYPQTVG